MDATAVTQGTRSKTAPIPTGSQNGSESVADESLYRGRFVRDVFTGELREVRDDPAAEFEELNRLSRENAGYDPGRNPNPWYKDNICRPMSLLPEEATPERIAQENEEARRHGTGARYDGKGECYLSSRGVRSRELRRPKLRSGIRLQQQDFDGGYSD